MGKVTLGALGALILAVVAGCASEATNEEGSAQEQGSGALALRFLVEPSDGTTSRAISPTVAVAFVDSTTGAVMSAVTSSVVLKLVRVGEGPPPRLVNGSSHAVAGVARFPALIVATPGTYYLEATSKGVSAISSRFTVRAGPPRLVWDPSPVTTPWQAYTPNNIVDTDLTCCVGIKGKPGHYRGVPPLVRLLGGDGTSSHSVVVTLEDNPTGATLSGTLSAQVADGVASFPHLRINKRSEPPTANYTLKAQIKELGISAVSSAFPVLGKLNPDPPK